MSTERSSIRSLVLTWVALVTLLGCTIGATFLPLGPFMLPVHLGIAFTQATLAFWLWMHLNELDGVVRLSALGAFAWIAILFLLTATDYLTR